MSDKHITADQFKEGLNAAKSAMGEAISVDTALNVNSSNPVQNKVVTTAINTLTTMSELTAETAQAAENSAKAAQAAAEEAAAKAVRGSTWYSGTAITGTSKYPVPYDTGIEDAKEGDMYFNPETYNIYRCTISYGAACWAWTGNINSYGKIYYTTATSNKISQITLKGDVINNPDKQFKLNDLLITADQDLYTFRTADQNDTWSWTYITSLKSDTITVDTSLSSTSTNPVQNKVINTALNGKMNATNPTGSGYVSFGRKSGTSIGNNSVVLGYNSEASSTSSVAIGYQCKVTGAYAVSIGYGATSGNSVNGMYGVAIGTDNSAERDAIAIGQYNHVDTSSYAIGRGNYTDSNGTAMGSYNECGKASVTIGYELKVTAPYATAIGKYNADRNSYGTTTPEGLFEIGFGYYDSETEDDIGVNVFRVSAEGKVYAREATINTGADYAEYIKPWFDNNEDNEDRRGYFVTIRNGLLYKAEPDDYIVGITSGNPSVIGNGDEDWLGRWKRDEFNQLIYEDIEVADFDYEFDEDGNRKRVKIGSHTERHPVQVENYDPTQEYVERKDRPEWSCVGMIGVIPLRDDGTCEAGGFAKCGKGGIATRADEWECHKTFFVIERINDHIVSVEMR